MCSLLNCRSILGSNNLKLFHSLTCANSGVYFITESWLSSEIGDHEITCLKKYSVYRCNRKGRGWGVLILVPNTLPSCKIECLANSQFEILSIKISQKNPIIFSLIYRSPGQNKQSVSLLKPYLDSISAKFPCSSHIFLGDLNYPDINWENSTTSHPTSAEFLNMCSSFRFS